MYPKPAGEFEGGQRDRLFVPQWSVDPICLRGLTAAAKRRACVLGLRFGHAV